MLEVTVVEEEGSKIKQYLVSLLNPEHLDKLPETTYEILTSVKVLLRNTPNEVKERVELVLSQLKLHSKNLQNNNGSVDDDFKKLEEVARAIGGVSETLVQWYINKKIRHDSSLQSEGETIPEVELELVKKFRNFLTRRAPRLYLPVVHKPTLVLEMCTTVFTTTVKMMKAEADYECQVTYAVRMLRTLAALLDIQDRIFVNRFPYRAQVFSFTEEFIMKMRESKSVQPHVYLLKALVEATENMVKCCRERLTGDVLLKRAESLAYTAGTPRGAGSHHTAPYSGGGGGGKRCDVVVTPVTLVCELDCVSNKGRTTLSTLSTATIPFILRKLSQQLRCSTHDIFIMADGEILWSESGVRAEDLKYKKINIIDKESSLYSDDNMVSLSASKIFARALYDFHVEDSEGGDENLEFEKEDIIEVLEKSDDGWWKGRVNKTVGVFPSSFVKVLSTDNILEIIQHFNELRTSSMEIRKEPLQAHNSAPVYSTPKRTPGRFLQKISTSVKRPHSFFNPDNKLFKAAGSKSERQRRQVENEARISGSIKEGLLKKEGSNSKFWNARYFVLHDNRIVYYKSVQARPPPSGIIDFTDIVFAAATPNTPAHSHCFTIQGRIGKRSYFLMAKSQTDMNEWLQVINQGLRYFRSTRAEDKLVVDKNTVKLEAINSCLEYLMSQDRYTSSNFLRRTGNEREMRRLLGLVNQGEIPELEMIANYSTVFGLLKTLFRGLPVLIEESQSKELLSTMDNAEINNEGTDKAGEDAENHVTSSENHVTTKIFDILQDMDALLQATLRKLLKLFSLLLQYSNENGVSAIDISRMFGMSIFGGVDVVTSERLVLLLIQHVDTDDELNETIHQS